MVAATIARVRLRGLARLAALGPVCGRRSRPPTGLRFAPSVAHRCHRRRRATDAALQTHQPTPRNGRSRGINHPGVTPLATIARMRRMTRGTSVRRRRGPLRSVLVRNLLLLAVALVSLVLVLGLVFAGSPTTIANGVRIDGIDVGGLQAKNALAMLQRRSGALAGKPVVFLAGGRRFTISPSTLGVRSDWVAAIDSAQRQGGGFGPLRGFRRIDVDFFGADVIAADDRARRGAPVPARADREEGRPSRARARGADPRPQRRRRAGPLRPHTRPGRIRPRDRRGPLLARPQCGAGAAAVPQRRAAAASRRARARGPAGPDRAVGPRPARARREALARAAGPARDAARTARRRPHAAPDRRPRRAGLARRARHPRRAAPAQRPLRRERLDRQDRSRPAGALPRRRPERRGCPPGCDAPHEPRRPPRRRAAAAEAHDRRRPPDGHRRRRRLLHDRVRRHREPDPQRPARRAPRRRQADRARRDVLVQRHDRRAHRREGLPRGARDHQRRGHDRPRRRRLPGLDDRLQRRLRGGAADPRAGQPRALHQPLPAGPRRDRRLPRRRPEVRQRHPALAAAADVRRLLLAHRDALRDADRPEGREHDRAARRARQGRRSRRPSTRR